MLSADTPGANADAAASEKDERPYLGFSSPRVAEGDSGSAVMTFTARLTDANGRTQSSKKTVTADYKVSSEGGDTATPGKDYEETRGTVTFAPGETSKTVDVTVLGDTEVEDDETLTIRFTHWSNVLLVHYTQTGTIVNDDEEEEDSPTPYLGFSGGRVAEGDSGSVVMRFTARLTDANGRAQASEQTVTADYKVSSEGGDTATAGRDYEETSGRLTFAPGETSKTVDVTVLGDTEVEDDETLTIRFTGWSNVLLVHYTQTGTIENDDGEEEDESALPYLGFSSPRVAEGDSGSTAMTFTARLTDANGHAQSSERKVTATYRVSSEDGDTATAGKDYEETSGRLTFAPGETSKTVDVTVLGDTEVEDDETLTIRFTGWSNVLLVHYAQTGAIVNDDKAPRVSARLSVADASADEGNALSFVITLDKAVPGGFTVTPTFTDGVTLPGKDLTDITANRGSDYSAGTQTLNFAGTAGETVTLTVPTVEDGVPEYPELFTVGLSVSGTSHRVTAAGTATGTIRDDDAVFSASSSRHIQDKGTYWRLWSPPDPVTNRYEYYCDISKRVVETTNNAVRSKVFQIPCKVHQGGIPAGAVVEMWATGSSTATNGSSGDWDYNFYHTRFTMYPGDRGTQRLSFRINDDQGAEAAESFQFGLKWTTKIGYPPFWFT